MAELANCSRCDAVFVKDIRTICQNCYKEEERDFDTVYRFLRDRKNREATVEEIAKATGVPKTLIMKFVKEKRLRTSQFPKLAYPCDKCGTTIVTGHLCFDCYEELKRDLEQHEKNEERSEQQRKKERKTSIYYSIDEKRK